MLLAHMINTDEDALVCDLAETYHLFDYRQLPLTKVAVFALGLRDDSRIKMRMSRSKINLEQMLLASISDKLAFILWSKTEDGQRNRNRPQSILDILVNEEKESNVLAFNSGDDFMEARRKLIETTGGESDWDRN